MKKYTKFRPTILSRHPSHSVLRRKHKKIPLLPFKSVVRFGSSTEVRDTKEKGGSRVELNSIQAIKTSSNKLLMKEAFAANNIKTAIWNKLENFSETTEEDGKQFIIFNTSTGEESSLKIPFPIVGKSYFGSRGRGNTLLKTIEDFNNWKKGKTNYLIEKFHNYNKEYRLHVDSENYFYTCRKMIKSDTPEENKWYKNDSNSVWILEENENFEKPNNWNEIVAESVKALKAVGLDFGAVDLRVQNNTNNRRERRANPLFIVIEINSAPSFGEITSQKYIEHIPTLLTKKYEGIIR